MKTAEERIKEELAKMPLHSAIEIKINLKEVNPKGSYPMYLTYAITKVLGGFIYTNESGRMVFIPNS
jgi:hypothetical protein